MMLADEDDFRTRAGWTSWTTGSDPAKGTLRVRATFPNADRSILPGMFARVRLETGVARKMLLVPQGAFVTNNAACHLLVVNPQGDVALRRIQPGNVL